MCGGGRAMRGGCAAAADVLCRNRLCCRPCAARVLRVVQTRTRTRGHKPGPKDIYTHTHTHTHTHTQMAALFRLFCVKHAQTQTHTGGIALKVEEAAAVARMGIPVLIAQAGSEHGDAACRLGPQVGEAAGAGGDSRLFHYQLNQMRLGEGRRRALRVCEGHYGSSAPAGRAWQPPGAVVAVSSKADTASAWRRRCLCCRCRRRLRLLLRVAKAAARAKAGALRQRRDRRRQRGGGRWWCWKGVEALREEGQEGPCQGPC